jgi:hypothetical protein
MQRDRKNRQNRSIFLLLLALGLVLVLVAQSEREKDSADKRGVGRIIKVVTKAPAAPKYPMQVVSWFQFSDQDALKDWEEKVFKGRVAYTVEKEKALSFVQAKSEAAASALYYKVGLDPQRSPVISWRWRVDKFPVKTMPEDLERQEDHDFAARVYVIFPTFFLMNSKVLEYIWAKDLPVGKTGTSPYSRNIKLMVLESGPAAAGEWRTEERDIVADYIKAFGEPPNKDVGAVSFMTNAEHTGTSAEALYDDIKLGYKEEKAGGRL